MAVLETTATRRKIVKELQRNKIGFTARELSESLKIKVQTISATLQQMALGGFVQRGELIEGKGQIWEVTELGIAEYGVKSDLEVKTNVQVEAESHLEQKQVTTSNVGESKVESEKQVKTSPVDSKMETTESELTGLELAEKRFNEMEIGTFEVFQLTDNLASSFIELMQAKQAKPIENIDYKIATLESLADIYNPKISATLREIAADLRG